MADLQSQSGAGIAHAALGDQQLGAGRLLVAELALQLSRLVGHLVLYGSQIGNRLACLLGLHVDSSLVPAEAESQRGDRHG